MESKQYVGLDIHKKFIYGVVTDYKGNIIFENKIINEPKHLDKFLAKIDQDSDIALESCICWEHIYDYLDDAGFRNLYLANPSRIGLIAHSHKKTDAKDAKILADLLRTNMLPLSYAPSKDIRDQRQITRHRESLGRVQTDVKNKVHAILIRNGIVNPFENAFTKESMEFLKGIELSWSDRYQLDNYLRLIVHIENQKKKSEELIKEYVDTHPSAKLLCTIPGIATYSGLMISAEIGDIRRFQNAKQLTSFAGLNPRVSQSGEKLYVGKISKQGDKHLRWMLGQCANIAIMHDSTLSKVYHRIKKRRGHNVAITAVARKMLSYIFTMLSNNIKYNQLHIHKNKAS